MSRISEMKKCEYRIVENYEGNCRIVGKEKVFERTVARIKKLGEDFFWKWVESADDIKVKEWLEK